MYQNILPAMIQVIGQTVETGNDVGARHLFDVLETLLILVRILLHISSGADVIPGSSHPQQKYSRPCRLPPPVW